MVRGLLGVVDCNVQGLVHQGYSSLFVSGSPVESLLTLVLTIYVALVGYQLLLGRTQLRVTDFAITAVKLGAVLALATQWDTYQRSVYDILFQGPQAIARLMLKAIQPEQSQFRGDVFDGLQRAFDDLNGFANQYAAHSPPTASPLLGGAGTGALALTAAAAILLLSSLGVLLAAKIVLALLLAIGPIFIVLFLFDATRGLFQGWMRASLALAIAPLIVTVMLGLALVVLEPSLIQIEALRQRGIYSLDPTYSVMILVLVFAGVNLASLVAAAVIAGGFNLPRAGPAPAVAERAMAGIEGSRDRDSPAPVRAARIAAAVSALERRDSATLSAAETSTIERRIGVGAIGGQDGGARGAAEAPVRLGQGTRRRAEPRPARADVGLDKLGRVG